jgi:hypothetical protein
VYPRIVSPGRTAVSDDQGRYAIVVDVGVRKFFMIRRYQFSAQADVFNVLNVSYVKNQNVTVGSSFGQPLDVLQPRLLRLAMQMKF